MARVWLLVGLVAVFMAVGVAGASVPSDVRIPVPRPDRQVRAELSASTVVVARGDHLWKISATHLGQRTPNEVVAPYWRRVVEVNTPTLRSGDPDLIYPGEIVELPAIERP